MRLAHWQPGGSVAELTPKHCRKLLVGTGIRSACVWKIISDSTYRGPHPREIAVALGCSESPTAALFVRIRCVRTVAPLIHISARGVATQDDFARIENSLSGRRPQMAIDGRASGIRGGASLISVPIVRRNIDRRVRGRRHHREPE